MCNIVIRPYGTPEHVINLGGLGGNAEFRLYQEDPEAGSCESCVKDFEGTLCALVAER